MSDLLVIWNLIIVKEKMIDFVQVLLLQPIVVRVNSIANNVDMQLA